MNPDEMRRQMKTEWMNAVINTKPVTAAQALVDGMHLRLNIKGLFNAIWHTTECWLHGSVIAAGHFDPKSIMGFGMSIWGAIHSTLDAIRSPMSPQAYLAAVVISRSKAPLTRTQFEADFYQFLARPNLDTYPWYLGIRDGDVKAARAAMQQKPKFDSIIDELQKCHMLEFDATGNATFRDCHWETGFEPK